MQLVREIDQSKDQTMSTRTSLVPIQGNNDDVDCENIR